jgi:surface protein
MNDCCDAVEYTDPVAQVVVEDDCTVVVEVTNPQGPIGPQGPQGPVGPVGPPGAPQTPASTVEDETTFGLVPAVGTSVNYAREDHTHGSQPREVPDPATLATDDLLSVSAGVYVGTDEITVDQLNFDTAAAQTLNAAGEMAWDVDRETVALRLDSQLSTYLNQDSLYHVVNQTGVTISKGTVVGAVGTLGVSGKILIAPYQANQPSTSQRVMGVTSENIANGAEGFVQHFGLIRGINTSAFSNGDLLWASSTVAGGFATTPPVAPNNKVLVALVVAAANNGVIFVRPTFGSSLANDELVNLSGLLNGDLLQYDSATGVFVPVAPTPGLVGAYPDTNPSNFVDAAGAAAAAPVQSVDSLTGAVDLVPRYAVASDTAPVSPFVGQRWVQTSTGRLAYWTGLEWVEIGALGLDLSVAAADPAFANTYVAGQVSGTPAIGELLEVSSVGPLVLVPRSKEDIVSDVIDLVLLVDTTAPSATTTTTLPLAGTVNVRVDWGDGTGEIFTTSGNKTHTYAAAGQYRVRVEGTLTGFGAATARPEIVGCLSFGRLGITTLFRGLRQASNLVAAPSSLPLTVTNLQEVFFRCFAFNGDVTKWVTNRVTVMQSLFNEATVFNQDIGGWDTSSVTNMTAMFNSAPAFNQDIGGWDTSSVTSMIDMFLNATSFNQNIGGWDVGSATNMNRMLQSVTSFDQDLGGWRPSKVTTMTNFLLNVTLSTANYDALLTGWTDFTGTGWASGSITAFADAGGGQVTVTTATAHGYANGHVMRITGTTNYNGSYVISDVAATSFRITAAFVATETGTWNATLQSNVVFHGGNSQYSAGAATTARGVLTGAPYNWTITDGGQAP